jgi:hypothetical protein
MNKKFRSFEDARKFVHTLGLKGNTDWIAFYKSGNKPDFIPSAPRTVYKKEWKGLGDWLGTGAIAPQNRIYRSFEDARKFVHALHLKSAPKWEEYSKSDNKPDDIPSTPSQHYKNKGWTSWGDWLGTGTIAAKDRTYRSFEDARVFVRKLNLKDTKQWQKYCTSGNRPDTIPTNPRVTYKNKGWISLGDWLGTGTIDPKKTQFRSFEDARVFVRMLNLKNTADWRKYRKSGNNPNDIPSNPEQIYKNKGWISMGDFLGTGYIAPRNRLYRNFEDARKFVQSLGLKNFTEWMEYHKLGNNPDDIPSVPQKIYKNKGWISLGDWLGTGIISSQIISKNYLPWPEAKVLYRKIGKENNLKNLEDWKKYVKTHKLPKRLPAIPSNIYTKERVWRKIQK